MSTTPPRADQERSAEDRLEALLLEGLESGEAIQVTPEYIEQKRLRLIERHAKQSKTN